MVWSTRSFWIAVAAVLYVVVAALRAMPSRWFVFCLGPVCLLVGWRLVATPLAQVDRIEPLARSAARVVVSGAAIFVVAVAAPPTMAFRAVGWVGLAMACVASLISLTKVSSLGGIAARPHRTRFQAPIVVAALWSLGVIAALIRVVTPAPHVVVTGLVVDYAVVAAAIGSMAVSLVASYRLYEVRRFELGVAERASAALWFGILCLVVGVIAAAMEVAPPESVIPFAALLASLCVTMASLSQQPALVSRVLRSAAAVTVLCAPLVCAAAVLAYKAPTHAGLIMFIVTVAAACLGLASPRLARKLAPERGRWLTVLDEAIRVAKAPNPREAMIAVLAAIRDGFGRRAARAELYRLTSGDCATVDRADFLHLEQAAVPPLLIDIAEKEPERVLSTEALRYVQVQRADVRPVLAWLDARGAGAAVLALDGEQCIGVLLWPAAGRLSPLTYEEVSALRVLAEHLGSVTGATAQLERSHLRELEAEREVSEARERVAALQGTVDRVTARQRALAETMARPLRIANYSPAAQDALMRAERMGQLGLPMSLLAPVGVKALPWAASVHLASDRQGGSLVVVDANAPHDQSLEHWRESESSPFRAATDGTLVLFDAHVLPIDTQRYIASALPRETGLIAVLPESPQALLEQGRVDPHLADRLAERLVELPTLAERAEDLRALALYQLSCIGIRLRGHDLGLSLAAQQLINEYSWPGNDAELEAVLLRAALGADKITVEADDLRVLIGKPTGAPRPPMAKTGS